MKQWRLHDPASTTILVVDDNEHNRYFMRRWLTEAGYRVVEAASGQEGLAVARRQPDLIVLDIQMPDMSGLEVCRQLRSSTTTASIPVIQRSAVRIDNRDVAEGLRSGGSIYLTEPIDAELLLAAVDTLLSMRDVSRELELVMARSDAGIYQWDIITGRVTWSSTVELMHGLEPGEFGSDFESFQRFVHPDERDQVFNAIQQAINGDGEYTVMYRGICEDGTDIWLRSYGKVFRDTDGTPSKLLGVVLDVTEQRESAERLAQLHDLAADLNTASSTAAVMARIDKAAAAHGYKAQLHPRDQAVPPAAIGALRRRNPLWVLDLEPIEQTPVAPATDDQLHAIVELADSALSRAWRFDVERENAETLQRALLPPVLPQPPGWSLDSIYVPTSESDRLGGDFYDAVETDGRLLMLLGDVAGHGLSAVRAMGELRTTLRLLALEETDVASVIDRARNLALHLRTDEWLFTTVLVVAVDLATGTLEAVSCGHPPPVICSEGEARLLDVAPLPPIGVASDLDTRRYIRTDSLRGGQSLVLFTDGVIERRDETLDRSVERLRSSLAGLSSPPSAEDVVFHTDEQRLNTDDRAVLRLYRHPESNEVE